MGKRDRERKDRIRAGLESPIAHRIAGERLHAAGWEDWVPLEGFDDEAVPAGYLRQALDAEGIPYQVSKDAHPEQAGEAIIFDAGGLEGSRDFIQRITAKWIAEGRPCLD